MAYTMPIGTSTFPIAPTVHLYPAIKDSATLYVNCPGGVCITEQHDKVFRFTPQKESSVWNRALTYFPLIFLVLLLLVVIAWIPLRYNRRYQEYEDALEQRLIDAMDAEEREVKV